MLVFTVSNDCKCLGEGQGRHCRVEPLTHGNVSSQSCPGRSPAKGLGKESRGRLWNPSINKHQGPSLMFSWPSCPIFISGMRGLPAVRRVTVGGSVASRFPSLCLLFFRRASCVTDKEFTVCLLFPGLISMEGCMLMKLVHYMHGTIQV